MWLHWDGNNCSVDERNLSAGFGTGATPATIDRDRACCASPTGSVDQGAAAAHSRARASIARSPPRRGDLSRVLPDAATARGKAPFRGAATAARSAGDADRADRHRSLRGSTPTRPSWRSAQNRSTPGYPLAGDEACQAYDDERLPAERWRRCGVSRAAGQCYPARFIAFPQDLRLREQPLDGLWLRAPYLHNGSVPNARARCSSRRAAGRRFYTGYDVYDYDNVGFVTQRPGRRQHGLALRHDRAGQRQRRPRGRRRTARCLDPAEKNAP